MIDNDFFELYPIQGWIPWIFEIVISTLFKL